MKKFLVAILSFLYLAVSTGATVNLHYCMDKYVGWDFQSSKSNTCSNCGMKKSVASKKGCCKEEHKQLKLQNDQKTAEASVYGMHFTSSAIPVVFSTYRYELIPSVVQEFPVSHAPPDDSGVGIYLLNHVFRI